MLSWLSFGSPDFCIDLFVFYLQVLSIFLDVLVLLITVHRQELNDWLNTLLTKLLNKTGTDVLGSIQAKIQKALETVR